MVQLGIKGGEQDDLHWMRCAIALSYRNLGATGDNPSVGALIVHYNARGQGLVIGRGVTQSGGRPHAEIVALNQASEHYPDLIKGAVVYVTLEPCAHQGRSGSCAQALIAAGVARVVCAFQDPNPQVSGQGFAALRQAGIDVETDLLAQEAWPVLRGFFSRIIRKRPFVIAKLASSLDGKIALASGQSQWISSEKSRRHVHLLRAQADALFTGIGTALSDNPRLTVRLDGLEQRSPLRVILDRQGRLPPDAALLDGSIPTQVYSLRTGDYRAIIEERENCSWQSFQGLPALLEDLGTKGVNVLMVEAGAGLVSSLLKEELIDALDWYTAPLVIGQDGYGAIAALDIEQMSDLKRWQVEKRLNFDQDLYQRLINPASRAALGANEF